MCWKSDSQVHVLLVFEREVFRRRLGLDEVMRLGLPWLNEWLCKREKRCLKTSCVLLHDGLSCGALQYRKPSLGAQQVLLHSKSLKEWAKHSRCSYIPSLYKNEANEHFYIKNKSKIYTYIKIYNKFNPEIENVCLLFIEET